MPNPENHTALPSLMFANRAGMSEMQSRQRRALWDEGVVDDIQHAETLFELARLSMAQYGGAPSNRQIFLSEYQTDTGACEEARQVYGSVDLEAYFKYLRNRSPQEIQLASIKARALDTYSQFEDCLHELLALPDPDQYFPDSYINSGGFSDIYKFERDGKEYAARFPSLCILPIVESALQASAIIEANDIQGIERIVAASYRDGVTVSEFFPGHPLHEYSKEVIANVPQYHYEDLIRNVAAAEHLGVECDLSNANNILYSPQEGFMVVDIATEKFLNTRRGRYSTPNRAAAALKEAFFTQGLHRGKKFGMIPAYQQALVTFDAATKTV